MGFTAAFIVAGGAIFMSDHLAKEGCVSTWHGLSMWEISFDISKVFVI